MSIRKPIVYLVGAGPGDPGLLTLRGKACLDQADFVLYDQLISPRMLQLIPERAEKLCVRDLPGAHPERWPHIHERLIAEARLGKCVVRLKGGDPLIFGRGGEEAEALREAGIPYEIVPGVTAAFAAGAYLDIPLTHRAHASAIALVTGHEQPGKPNSRVDWAHLARFPGTLAIYMGLIRLSAIVAELLQHGLPADTPAAAVSRASTGEQRSVASSLGELEAAIRHAGLTTPVLILIGEVVGLKHGLSWFEQRRLLGLRILVTRPRHQAAEMLEQLEMLGAVPYLLPALEIREPADWRPTDQALLRMRNGEYDWLIFTSVNGVDAFFGRLFHHGRDLRDLAGVQIAVIGSSTAAALRRLHLQPDIAPAEDMRSEALLKLLTERVVGQKILLAQAEGGRELLREQLAAIASIEAIAVYQQVEAIRRDSEVFDQLRRGEIDIVTLTSPNIARAFLAACDEVIRHRIQEGHIQLVTNSPRISAYLNEQGLPVSAESRTPTQASIIEAIEELADRRYRAVKAT